MTDWYHWFLLCILLLWILSVPRDRSALRILLIASLASEVITESVTSKLPYDWSLVIPCSVELATLISFIRWSKNRTGYIQARIVAIMWLTHVLCYLDIALRTDIVYSRYEAITQLVAVAQILACYETIARCGSAVAAWIGTARAGSGRGFRVAGVCYRALHGKAAQVVQATGGTEKTGRVSN